jgi:tartrate-resistant acid phosphatase type 5
MIFKRFFQISISILLASALNSEAAVTIPEQFNEIAPANVSIPQDIPLPITEATMKSTGIRILVFGDSGTGDEVQMRVAKGMQAFCARNGCHFGLLVGDNFYPAGVTSADDPQFVEKFEKPYSGMGIPIFVVLGEHDWGRKGKMYNWQAQIEYSKKSKIWKMPSDVYTVTSDVLKIMALDTNSLPISKYQKQWLDEELKKSKARWNLVIGHKPVYSYGYHGDTPFMVQDVLPILCGRADLYLSGHEHNSQVLRADCGIPLIVSGSAGKPFPKIDQGDRTLYVNNQPGFSYLIVQENKITVQMISENGEILYSLDVPKK